MEPSELTTATPETATLADLRGWAGLTQAELAARCGLPRSTYAPIERGILSLRPEVAERLARALGRDVVEILAAHARSPD